MLAVMLPAALDCLCHAGCWHEEKKNKNEMMTKKK